MELQSTGGPYASVEPFRWPMLIDAFSVSAPAGVIVDGRPLEGLSARVQWTDRLIDANEQPINGTVDREVGFTVFYGRVFVWRGMLKRVEPAYTANTLRLVRV